jgi:uncharacterized protein (DUF58 family)
LLKIYKNLFFSRRFFVIAVACALFLLVGYFFPALFLPAKAGVFGFLTISLLDFIALFGNRNAFRAVRTTGERFSLGDANSVQITVQNRYPYTLHVSVYDELPVQLQIRDHVIYCVAVPGSVETLRYTVRPSTRGEYRFDAINCYVSSPLGLVSRRFRFEQHATIPVYPSFMQMRKYELYAISNRLTGQGLKRVRQVGHTLEFDHIRSYVVGDDFRTMNWKATAHRGELMVNQYEDERSQQVYVIIDKGRVMEMPFAGMSLLDYAINTSLIISNTVIRKGDKAGLITFADTMDTVLPADRKVVQIQKIVELLYNESTRFPESNYELLYSTVRRRVRQRSLLLLFTNFESLSSMKRQLPYLQRLGYYHLLVVIFFLNTELFALLQNSTVSTEDIYVKTIAEQFCFEKRQIVKELASHGIQAILTTPENLSIDTLNKYIELKARALI